MIWAGLLLTLDAARGQTWSPASVNTNYYWSGIACSANGIQLAAAVASAPSGSGIYLSTNSGATWFLSTAPAGQWYGIASSADGTKLVAAGSSIYLSTNSGSTWVAPAHAPFINAVASSADGSKLLGFNANGFVYVSTNSGGTWSMGPNFTGWNGIAISADGSKMAAVMNLDGSPVFVSTNFGVTWTRAQQTIGQPDAALACSADGSRLMLATVNMFYLSTNWGATWSSTNASPADRLLASSADGSVLLSCGARTIDAIYTSTNSGVTWSSNNVPPRSWVGFACSADGNLLVGTEQPGLGPTGGGIWISQSPPAPQVCFTTGIGNLNLSWTVPSMNMVLAGSPNLSHWTVLTNEPVLNELNLQEQVAIPLGSSNGFFRLISQ